MKIPSFVLRQLYVKGSLRREPTALRFALRNTLAHARLTGLRSLRVDGQDIAPDRVRLRLAGREVDPTQVSKDAPLEFERGAEAEVRVAGASPQGKAKVRLEAESAEFGPLVIEFEDTVA